MQYYFTWSAVFQLWTELILASTMEIRDTRSKFLSLSHFREILCGKRHLESNGTEIWFHKIVTQLIYYWYKQQGVSSDKWNGINIFYA